MHEIARPTPPALNLEWHRGGHRRGHGYRSPRRRGWTWARLAEAFSKYHPYDYRPEADAWSGDDGGGLGVLPRRALAWFAFPHDCALHLQRRSG